MNVVIYRRGGIWWAQFLDYVLDGNCKDHCLDMAGTRDELISLL